MSASTLNFEEQAELAALEGFEMAVQFFCSQRAGRAAQIFAGYMTPKQHRRLAELRAKVEARQPEVASAAA